MDLQVQSNHPYNESSEPQLHADRRRKNNTAGFIISLVALFFGCYIVVTCFVLCFSFKFSCRLSDNAGQIVTLLFVLNSAAVNPLVYAFLKKDIKRQIKKLICREN